MLQSPPTLRRGDKIAIVSPASAIKPELIEGARQRLEAEGFSVEVMPHAAGKQGPYSGTESERVADMALALANPEIKAILCARGGYGCVHLIGHIEPRPVWLIGFSDVSALHALWLSHGLRSIHGSMAKELTLSQCPGDRANHNLLQILHTGHMPAIEWDAHPLNRPGSAEGTLLGGNLAVLNGLATTPLDILGRPGSIMVIEDVAEPVYKVERVLHRLRLAGALDRLGGLVVGQFTEYTPRPGEETMEQMIARMVAPYSFPVAFNAPIGHIAGNLPFIEGAEVRLTVTEGASSINE